MKDINPDTLAVMLALMDGRERTVEDIARMKPRIGALSIRSRLIALVRAGFVEVDRVADNMTAIYRAKPDLITVFKAAKEKGAAQS